MGDSQELAICIHLRVPGENLPPSSCTALVVRLRIAFSWTLQVCTLFLASLTSLACFIKVRKATIPNEEFGALFLAGLVCKFSNENKGLCECFCSVFASQVVVSTLNWMGVSKFRGFLCSGIYRVSPQVKSTK